MSEPRPYSWGQWAGGCTISLIGGAVFVIAVLVGVNGHGEELGAIVGLVPGVLFLAIGAWRYRTPLGTGMVMGSLVVILLGGMCGAMAGAR